MMRLVCSMLLICAWALPLRAAESPADFGFLQHPGADMPGNTQFVAASGQALALRDLFGKVPVILDLGYFHCTTLCSVVRDDLLHALQASGLRAGADYELAALSIDPAETPADAAEARQADLARYHLPGADSALHYLVAQAQAIRAVTEAVGFRSRFDPRFKQFLHPAGLVILTPSGTVSSYLLGLGYKPGDVRAAVLRAGQFGIAKASLPVLLLCFHYDPGTGRYTLAVLRLLSVMAGITVAMLGALLLLLHRRDRARGAA